MAALPNVLCLILCITPMMRNSCLLNNLPINLAVSSQPSLGGTYTGIEPMGLLWSAVPRKRDLHKYPRLIKLDPTRPWTYTLSMIDGSLDMLEDSDGNSVARDRIMDSLTIERHYVAPYVERIPVEEGQLKGTLFIPHEKCEILVLNSE